MESSLLCKLQSTDLKNILQVFSDYLHPFTVLLAAPNPNKKPNKTLKTEDDHRSTARALAKQFLPFLNSALSLLPKRLSETPKIDSQIALELFDTYKLCLDCLNSVSSQLSCKPYVVQIQRVRLIHCFETWGRYGDAEIEGFSVLESLRGIGSGGLGVKMGKLKGRIVPYLGKENVDHEFALLVVEVAVTLVKCASMNQSKEEGDYRRVLALVDEIAPWFRVLDAKAYEKLHRVLVIYLNKCTLLLVGELTRFNGNLVREFCLATFSELAKSSMKDQMPKFAQRICHSIFSQQDNQSSSFIDILVCVLDSMAGECEVGMENPIVEFLELVCYCANKCRTAAANICGAVATHLNNLAGAFDQVFLSPIDLIMGLYATGLLIGDFSGQSRWGDLTTPRTAKDLSVLEFLLGNEDRLQNLTNSLSLLKCHYNIGAQGSSLPFSAECKNIVNQTHSGTEFNQKASMRKENGKSYRLCYYNALKFLCQPLAVFLTSERKEILAENKDVSFTTMLCSIQDAFHQFCEVFLLCHSESEMERDAFDDNNKTVLDVAVAAFILSFATKRNIKTTVNFIKHVISSDWIQANGLKFLFASLYNVGVVLYRNNNMKESSKALKLGCRAAWTCVLQFSEMFVDKPNGVHGDQSEDAIAGFVTEACAKSAFLLDVLYQCGSHKVNGIVGESLENWSVAEKLFKSLPSPIALVKQWVKIECKLSKDVDAEHSATTLYSLLSSSAKVSKKTLGILSELELLAYNEMNYLNPKLCQRMRLDIIGILLAEMYVTKDSCLQKSRILIAKGRELRACGPEGLNDCINCLSEAISTMNDMYGETYSCCNQVCHQLASAYCLRALCTQEAEPNSKQLFQDIHAALNLWLSLDHSHAANQKDIMSKNTLSLLYHVVDLLSMKGYMKFHPDIYEMMIRLFKWRNVPLEKCLAMLWECRRLGHALCASPVNETFITTLSKHCGELSKSMEFWISCMKGSQPLQVGFQHKFSFMFTIFSSGLHHHESSFRSDITIDEVKQVASDLISSVPLSSGSVFLAAYLYYDLCENLVSNGRLIEALSYAKEGHRLRSKLLQEKFMYSVEHQNEIYDENGKIVKKHCYCLKTFQVHTSVATATWLCDNITCGFEGHILTPWNVLQCYLESTLQVGIIQEIVGNGSEAEILLLWGKNISSFQGLPLFVVAFSSILGKLYCKQRLWYLAEEELQSAKKILADSGSFISCLKCRLVLEVTIDQQLGDFSRSRFGSNTGNSSIERLSYAENIYRSALNKLNLSEWKNSVSNPEEASAERTVFCDMLLKEVSHGPSSSSNCATNHSEMREFPSKIDGTETKIEPKRSRKSKKAAKPLPQGQCLMPEHNSRMTRSRYRSSQKNSECITDEVRIGLTKYSESKNVFACPDELDQQGAHPEIKCSAVGFGCEIACDNKIKCWHCLPLEVMESRSLNNFIHMKWEFVRRRLLLRLLTGIGKCLGVRGEIHKAHEIFSESISVLVSRNPFSSTKSSVPSTFPLDLIGKDIPGDVLAVERASVLYNICWFYMESYSCKGSRADCCDLSRIQIPRIVSWLKLAFILCREVPILFQKVSRLLAVLYILFTSIEPFSVSLSSCNALSESQWASFFHQASVGTHFNHQLFSHMTGKQKVQNPIDVEGYCLSNSTPIGSETLNSLRLAPDSLQDLEGFVLNFFESLPSATIICVSLLGGAYKSLLREMLIYPSSIHAWILLSRLNSNGQPVNILLPVDSILEEASDDKTSGSGILCEGQNVVKRWHCPWGSTVVDDVAPVFKLILEENYLSSSTFPLEDTKRNRSLWWMQRRRLDERLDKFLRDLEDSWFGPWKYLFLGGWSDCKRLDSVQKKLADDLKFKCQVDVHESLLKVIVGGGNYACQREECVSQIILSKGCYIGGMGYCNNERSGGLSNKFGVERLSQSVFNLILETAHDVEEKVCVDREPIILVLDFEVQMLPWENLPILRNQEVYRMPSVVSISATLDRYCHRQGKVGTNSVLFPLIDPLDAYYLLNPSGDLSSTEVEFESWFRDQNLEGKTGTTPTIEELSVALKSHDLFIYFGHGSGAQYIPGHEIQKLDKCAATLLMGCSSGSLSLDGCYAPQGAPLCYLLAGSPVIIANLWEVTDKDIDRFAKAMLDSWLRERSTASMGCPQCDLLSTEFKSLSINGTKGNGRSKIWRKKLPEAYDVNMDILCCKHRPKIGSFMGKAREACTLPFLIGASPVCYGVPTGILKKDL